jgi:hypothetical protein
MIGAGDVGSANFGRTLPFIALPGNAFEGVGVVFLPQDDVQLRSDVSGAR